jgi:signal peptidase I
MRCERCKFENIPGQKTCIKCGSTLEIKSTAINVHPPRMSKWKKPFRDLQRLIRRGKVVPQENIRLHYPPWIKEVFSDSFLGLFLSIIPGLAHFIQNRFREIRWYFLAWLVLLISGLFLYGSAAGFICLGLAVGVHAGIAVQYGIIKDLVNLREKIVTVILVLLALAFIYRFTPRILVPNLTGGYSSLSVPYYKVEAGDYLLTWGGLDQGTLLARGSLVLIYPVTFTSHGRTTKSKEEIIGQIVGLAGEHLEIQEGFFVVNGQQLEVDKYPVPQWLQKVNFSATIPDESYFVSAQYNVAAHGLKLEASHICQVCVVKSGDIEAKAFMRWWPLLKRGFIR